MTLQFALLIIASCAAMGLAAMKWFNRARADLERLKQQEHWVGRFARGARLLLNDERVPEPLLATVASLNRYLLEPYACELLYHVFAGPRQDRLALPEEAEIYRAHPDVAQMVSETLFAALMAITYTNLQWGDRARGAMARLYRGDALVTELATRAVREVSRNDHPTPSGLVAA